MTAALHAYATPPQDTNQLFLSYGLGWRANLADANARVAGQMKVVEGLMPSGVDELLADNGLDVQLYRFGAVLQEVDGFMFQLMAAAGVSPYTSSPDGSTANSVAHAAGSSSSTQSAGAMASGDVGAEDAVGCGYIAQQQALLGRERVVRYNVTFPRIYSADEKPRPYDLVVQQRLERQQQQGQKGAAATGGG